MLSAALRMPGLRLDALNGRHWLTSAVLAALAGLYLFAGLSLAGDEEFRAIARVTAPTAEALQTKEAPPAPEPLQFRAIDPTDAVAYNASIPLSNLPNPAARAFVLRAASEGDSDRALDCLTAAVYYEAATEPLEGQRAVAQVVLNRVRHPAFPKSVCGVVWQGAERSTGCQFTFTCDGSLQRGISRWHWERAAEIAKAALAGKVYKPVGYATHYHTNWVVPYWSSSLTKLANVGTHIFYRWEGSWGTPPAFRYGHAGVEPDVSRLGNRGQLPVLIGDELAADIDALAAAAAEGAPAIPGEPAVEGSVDSFGRAVLRRYEPLREAAAAKNRAALDRPEVPASMRWALTGSGESKTEPAKAPPAKVAPAAKAAPAKETAGEETAAKAPESVPSAG